MEGVVAFLDAKTIKTGNLFVFAHGAFDSETDEEVEYSFFVAISHLLLISCLYQIGI